MYYEMVELGDYPLEFCKDTCSKVRNNECPFEMNRAELLRRMKEMDSIKPFDKRIKHDLRYCWRLALRMKESYGEESIDVGKRNGKVVRVNNGRHRLCIGKKTNKKVYAWVELE